MKLRPHSPDGLTRAWIKAAYRAGRREYAQRDNPHRRLAEVPGWLEPTYLEGWNDQRKEEAYSLQGAWSRALSARDGGSGADPDGDRYWLAEMPSQEVRA